jgi:hypothetical protein
MRYKVELTIMTLGLICLSLGGVAFAGGVVKTLYVDGNQIGQGIGPAPLSDPYTRLTIGAEGSAWYRYNEFAGKIDEFAVYNGVLSDANITEHYTAGPAGYVAAVMASSPRLYLRFEDANSNNNSRALNSGSADVNGTYIDGVTLPAGYVGKAASFRGLIADANGDCIDVADEYTYLTLDNLTVEFWINTTQATDYPRLFQHNNGQAEMGGYGAMYAAGTDAIGLIGGGDTDYVNVPDPNLNNGAWHHVVITFASTRDYATEVLADDPCAYVKFDNTLPVDSSEQRHTAGLGRSARIRKTAGGIGGSLYLDDVNILIDINRPDPYGWVFNNYGGAYGPLFNELGDEYAFAADDISFEVWIKSDPCVLPSRYGLIFQQFGSYTREPMGPGLGVSDGNIPSSSVLRVAGGGAAWWYPGVNTPMDGLWHQIVVTYDESPDGNTAAIGLQFFMDGTLRNSTVINEPNGRLGPELNHLMIGSGNDRGLPSYNFWGGYIDEFSIYAGVLRADRVATHYAAWQPSSCAEKIERGLGLKGDLDGDCDVDFYDYAIFASEWLKCDDPSNPNCTANW